MLPMQHNEQTPQFSGFKRYQPGLKDGKCSRRSIIISISTNLYSALPSFSIAVALIHMQRHTLRPNSAQELS